MLHYLKLLLWPFALLYGGIMALRNLFYTKGILTSRRFKVPVIVVGNLTVGGTGKTPHVEYLIRLLHNYKLAVLSRGYKRKTKGFMLADAQSTPAILGDEPFQYHRDFPGVTVAVAENRVEGISKMQEHVPATQVFLLDDAFQHRAVQASFYILLTDYTRLFYKDLVLPAGLLREPKYGAKRADAVIISKCPRSIELAEQKRIKANVLKYTSKDTPVYFSTFGYGKPVAMSTQFQARKEIILLTGIANAAPLVTYLQEQGYSILQHLNYPDHHTYTLQNLTDLKQLLQQPAYRNASILTTRKDAVKLQDSALADLTSQLPIGYMPVEVVFLDDAAGFDQQLLAHVQTFQVPETV